MTEKSRWLFYGLARFDTVTGMAAKVRIEPRAQTVASERARGAAKKVADGVPSAKPCKKVGAYDNSGPGGAFEKHTVCAADLQDHLNKRSLQMPVFTTTDKTKALPPAKPLPRIFTPDERVRARGEAISLLAQERALESIPGAKEMGSPQHWEIYRLYTERNTRARISAGVEPEHQSLQNQKDAVDAQIDVMRPLDEKFPGQAHPPALAKFNGLLDELHRLEDAQSALQKFADAQIPGLAQPDDDD